MENIMPHVNPVQIQKFLKGLDYPASKGDLLEKAKSAGADENVCASLEQLPEQEFQTPADVSQAFGQLSDSVDRSSGSTGTNEFLAQAVQDSLAEVELCEMALQKTQNDAVKAFAQRMIDEHSKMGREIEQLANKQKLNLPKDVQSEDKSVMKELSGLSGQDFDRRFIEFNVKDHEKDVKVFKHYAEQEENSEIKALAEKGARTLDEHLKMAREIEKQLKS
jgi:predicted outer membrane protein